VNFCKEFKPDLTPKEMLDLGVFGISYFDGKINKYPKSWFKKAKLSNEFDKNLNHFKVKAGLSFEEWEKKGWIMKEDSKGWLQWYCRFYMGRRILEIDKI